MTSEPRQTEPMTANPAVNANPAFGQLHQAYADRLQDAREARRQGKIVVGYVGNTVPVELILAAGCFPLRVAPASGGTAEADRYIESFSDVDTRVVLQMFMDGELDFLALLIIPRSSESYHKLYLSLRELKRVGATSRGPQLHLYEILHTQNRLSRAYGLSRTKELADLLATIGTTPVDDATLSLSLAATNQTRALLARLQQARQDTTLSLSGYEAQIASVAGKFMEVGRYNQLLAEWLQSGDKTLVSGPRLLVKGCPLDHADLHGLVEAAGGVVVTEDDDWGARAAGAAITPVGSPLESIFDHYYSAVPCPRTFPESIAERWYIDAVRTSSIDGVIFYLPQPDDIYGWDFPRQRAVAEAAGLPWMLIRSDLRYATDRPSVDLALRQFFASIEQGCAWSLTI